MCAMILNAIWPLTNNVEKGESGGVLQQQVTCVLKQRIILRIRRLGFGFVGVLIIVLVGFFLWAQLHMCTYQKKLLLNF